MAEEADNDKVTIADETIEIINNLENAPLIHVDGAQGFLAFQGIIKINLYQLVQEFDRTPAHPSAFKKLIVARLSMTPQTARSFATWLAANVMEESESPTTSQSTPSDGQ